MSGTPASVSVCICNYNYGQYVGEAVESALAQTRPAEVVVVDDGSTDNSRQVLESFGPRVTLITQSNAGQFAAASRALTRSTGDFVIFLDADDLLDSDICERISAAASAAPQATRLQWRLRVIGPDGQNTAQTFPPQNWPLPDGDLLGHIIRRRTYVWPPTSGNAYARTALNRLFPLAVPEPPWIDLFLAEATPLLGPVVSIEGLGGSYRYHSDNVSLAARTDLADYVQERITTTLAGHDRLRRIAHQLGCASLPDDPLVARDWALLGYRLASLRLAPDTHPVHGDRRAALGLRGATAVLTQPNYPWEGRFKRALWFAALSAAPHRYVRRIVARAYDHPFGDIPGVHSPAAT